MGMREWVTWEKGSYASAVYDFPLTSKWDPPMWVPPMWVPLACEREVIYNGYTKYHLVMWGLHMFPH